MQRYGLDINGGAELHARYLAELLSAHARVLVLTTCARDYITWRNELPVGRERINGVDVERFPVSRERDVTDFGRHSARVFHHTHSIDDELRWLDSEGPVSPGLLTRLETLRDELDFLLVFSIRYHTAYHAARLLPERAVLVPTAEREGALALEIFRPVFRGVRAIMYNSPEERRDILAVSGNDDVPGCVVGVGSRVPPHPDGGRARRRWGLENPFVIYVGRVDANKGCGDLFEHFLRYRQRSSRPLDLVLVGRAVMDVPEHPSIRALGFVTDDEKFDLIAAAELLVMPSFFESLSMVALEAWALGRPVLANARCDVLVGQCLRSNGGLYYANGDEFEAALDLLLSDGRLAARLGENGRRFYARHYGWDVIERKYLDMFDGLNRTPKGRAMPPPPGWWERRRRRIAPAEVRLANVPTGPAMALRDTGTPGGAMPS